MFYFCSTVGSKAFVPTPTASSPGSTAVTSRAINLARGAGSMTIHTCWGNGVAALFGGRGKSG